LPSALDLENPGGAIKFAEITEMKYIGA
jgi:hypothetical protein